MLEILDDLGAAVSPICLQPGNEALAPWLPSVDSVRVWDGDIWVAPSLAMQGRRDLPQPTQGYAVGIHVKEDVAAQKCS